MSLSLGAVQSTYTLSYRTVIKIQALEREVARLAEENDALRHFLHDQIAARDSVLALDDEEYSRLCHRLDTEAQTRPCSRVMPVSEEHCVGRMVLETRSAADGRIMVYFRCPVCQQVSAEQLQKIATQEAMK